MKHLFKYLPLVLLFVSCDRDNVSLAKDSTGAASYDERDWDWNKQTDGGLQIEIAWDGDTAIPSTMQGTMVCQKSRDRRCQR